MSDAKDLKHFLFAIAELADETGVATESAVQDRCGDDYRALWNTATDLRYLKPGAGPGLIALTTMGRFAAGTLG
jgi:putative alpha-1,2-mannosidase